MEMAEARTYPERETESERGPLIPPGSIFIISKSAAPAARSTRRRQRHSARKSVGRGQAGAWAVGIVQPTGRQTYTRRDGHRRAQGFWADVAGLAPRLPCLVCYFRYLRHSCPEDAVLNNVILLLYSRVLFSVYIKSQSHLLKISRNFESLNCLHIFQRIIFFIFIVSRKIMAWTRYSNVARVATDETEACLDPTFFRNPCHIKRILLFYSIK